MKITDTRSNVLKVNQNGSIDAKQIENSGKRFYNVTPSDTVDLSQGLTTGVLVGVDGDLAIIDEGGNDIILPNLAGGFIHPINCTRVKLTGTTASNIIAVYGTL